MLKKIINDKIILGIILVVLSALSFALATVSAKVVTINSKISGIEISFARFFIGFILISLFIKNKKSNLKPVKIKYVLMRAIFNTIAVIFFFMSIEYTTVTNANMLNMTYPVFVLFLSPFLNKEPLQSVNILYVLLTFIGIYFVISPDFKKFNIGDIFAVCSAIIASIAITSLREARKYDNSQTIIFYVMLFGLILNSIIMIPVFILPDWFNLVFIIISGLLAFLGQILLTIGYKYINASTGAIISSSRIIFAAIFGIFLFNDPLTTNVLAGGILIIVSIIGSGSTMKYS